MFKVNSRAYHIFAFPNIHIDFRVPLLVFNKILRKKNASEHLKHPILIYFLWTNIRSWSQFGIQTLSVVETDFLLQGLIQHCTMKETLVHIPALSLNGMETVYTHSRYKINLFLVLTGLLAWQPFSTMRLEHRLISRRK